MGRIIKVSLEQSRLISSILAGKIYEQLPNDRTVDKRMLECLAVISAGEDLSRRFSGKRLTQIMTDFEEVESYCECPISVSYEVRDSNAVVQLKDDNGKVLSTTKVSYNDGQSIPCICPVKYDGRQNQEYEFGYFKNAMGLDNGSPTAFIAFGIALGHFVLDEMVEMGYKGMDRSIVRSSHVVQSEIFNHYSRKVGCDPRFYVERGRLGQEDDEIVASAIVREDTKKRILMLSDANYAFK